jgi:hypothetical protein
MKIIIFIVGMMLGGAIAVMFLALLQANHSSYPRSDDREKEKQSCESAAE